MSIKLGSITIDSTDPKPLAEWWAKQLGTKIHAKFGDDFYIVQVPGLGVALSVQKVADPTPGKNRIHMDFRAADPGAKTAELVAAGATEIAEQGVGEIHWHTLKDPQGNVFCVSTESEDQMSAYEPKG